MNKSFSQVYEMVAEANELKEIDITNAWNDLGDIYAQQMATIPMGFVNIPMVLAICKKNHDETFGEWYDYPHISDETVEDILSSSNIRDFVLDHIFLNRHIHIKHILNIMSSLNLISLGMNGNKFEYVINEEECNSEEGTQAFQLIKQIPNVDPNNEFNNFIDFIEKVIETNNRFEKEKLHGGK